MQTKTKMTSNTTKGGRQNEPAAEAEAEASQRRTREADAAATPQRLVISLHHRSLCPRSSPSVADLQASSPPSFSHSSSLLRSHSISHDSHPTTRLACDSLARASLSLSLIRPLPIFVTRSSHLPSSLSRSGSALLRRPLSLSLSYSSSSSSRFYLALVHRFSSPLSLLSSSSTSTSPSLSLCLSHSHSHKAGLSPERCHSVTPLLRHAIVLFSFLALPLPPRHPHSEDRTSGVEEAAAAARRHLVTRARPHAYSEKSTREIRSNTTLRRELEHAIATCTHTRTRTIRSKRNEFESGDFAFATAAAARDRAISRGTIDRELELIMTRE
jgi:hypothetical protein